MKKAGGPGVPMKEALDADGCERVQRFLQSLVKAHRLLDGRTGRMDIANFMAVYRETFASRDIQPKHNGSNNRIYTPELLEKLRQMQAAGLKYSECAELLGVSAPTVRTWVQKYLKEAG